MKFMSKLKKLIMMANVLSDDLQLNNYLTIEALEDGLTVSFTNDLEYYISELKNWKTLTANTESTPINQGQTISFRANLTPNSSSGIGTFTISKRFNLSGNVMSMLFADKAEPATNLTNYSYAFKNLFKGCTTIVDASRLRLPATTLASNCYSDMFRGCSSLTAAPELPAKTLTPYCYASMFYNCSLLTSASALPVKTLANNCYSSMFSGCTSLTTAPELPATTLTTGCYQYMFYGCKKINYIKSMFLTTPSTTYLNSWVQGISSTGTFVKNAAATWSDTYSVSAIPSGWTVQTAEA